MDLHVPPERVVMTHGLWVHRFAADPAILGKALRLDGRGFVVVGVLPRGTVGISFLAHPMEL
jgi:hypothetical protein